MENQKLTSQRKTNFRNTKKKREEGLVGEEEAACEERRTMSWAALLFNAWPCNCKCKMQRWVPDR